jgi:hypothetical protein
MTFDTIITNPDFKVYLNNNPVWDYKLTGNILQLIAFDSGEDLETVTVSELADYLSEEEVEFDSVILLNEETQKEILDFEIEYDTVFLSNLLLK